MNPQNSQQASPMELPSPQVEAQQNVAEHGVQLPMTETGAAQALEQGASLPDPTQPMIDPAVPQAQSTIPPLDPTQLGNSATASSTTSMPAIADDNDLIEKEWVVKAKEIVEKTKADPHEQNKEMNKVRADYLKKRYNKDLKLSEE